MTDMNAIRSKDEPGPGGRSTRSRSAALRSWCAAVGALHLLTFSTAGASGGGPDSIAVLATDADVPAIAIARWNAPCPHAEAAAFASEVGAWVAAPRTPEARHRWNCLRSLPTLALGPCDGPWIDALRDAGDDVSAWRRIDGTRIDAPPWADGRPSASLRLPAVALLDPEARWLDSMPTPEGGGSARAVALVWIDAPDTDLDGLPDALEQVIARGGLETIDADLDRDGVVDGCRAFGDLDGSGAVDAGDLAAMLAAWGERDHPADLDGDGTVEAGDLTLLLSAWG